MEEVFCSLDAPFDGYKISNFGRIITPRGKEKKPYVAKTTQNGRTFYRLVGNIMISVCGEKKRKSFGIATEVYSRFGKNYVDGANVYHIDGDIHNNRIDNLRISHAYTEERTEEQIKKYTAEVLHIVKDYCKKNGIFDLFKKGFDTDDLIGDCCYMIWKYLPKYMCGGSFYAFCSQYIIMEIKRHYKIYKKRAAHEFSHGF